MTRWSPDTCKCVIDNYTTFVKRCLIHQLPATVDDVKTHTRSFGGARYNIPIQVWRTIVTKIKADKPLTAIETQVLAEENRMLADKAAEKART